MTAIIVSNADIIDYNFYKKYFDSSAYVICADGGIRHVKKLGVKPDVLLGDFDSIKSSDLEKYENAGVKIYRFPVKKDMTDTEIAVKFAVERGYRSIVIIGALGTRCDHSLSNIFILKTLLERGIDGVIVDEHNEIRLIKDKIVMKKEKDVRVSLLPLTRQVEGVTTKGLTYPLNNATIRQGSSWGVSNEFAQDTAEVSVSEGLLFVIKSRD